MDLEINKEISDDKIKIDLKGKLDTSTYTSLEDQIEDLDKYRDITFDFLDLNYISSVGLRILLRAYKSTLANGGKLMVINLNETVKTIFEETGFMDLLEN